ncbi:carboxypeptidase Q-like isoform X2 [Physella acuta]|nr:carboxypeptidase Q-like isoform X2 [Physella acuta]XP_059161641.1 carboxypeptidase Q-like isoform X2 [Physella acuta]XP_059161642.1 carboxypeptidase Q-like isoform X2 [Physella acuta]XP_059161644.1 carboxypeptidase Q-like isoform X2 [Physella acuta]XP_059161645.1 carboxypeptidase Q-like isoform X2 [Physella acuta]XP_059161646.1 carboxypeptidase Q-like isoform X2 [Physella acuta]
MMIIIGMTSFFLTVCLFGWTSLVSTSQTGWTDLNSFTSDIASHKSVADQIIDYVLTGPAKGQVYNRLANMTDQFGYRLCGSNNLEKAIDYMVDQFKRDGLENVHKEPVTIPHWVRGNEWAYMISPRRKKLSILGLGFSVGTPKEGITAQVLVVCSFDELHARASEAKGKIVVYNQIWENYGQSVAYRSRGATEAAKLGAVASLVRSATPLSVYSPHTGEQTYDDNIKKIPTACITVEDAELMWRISSRGEPITVTLYMEAQNLNYLTSYNTVAEIKGSTYPEQVVLVSGHLDSWDVGQGAMDDGGGAFISWEALSLVRQLGLRPKRTLRVVLWTCEEFGVWGGQDYFRVHKNESKNFDIVMESDMGTFTPQGLGFTGSDEAMKIMKNLALSLLARVNATLVDQGAEMSDIFDWPNVGVPAASIKTDNGNYFDFHHSEGDTMTVQDSKQMDLCAAVWAVTAFTLADLEDMLPGNRTA